MLPVFFSKEYLNLFPFLTVYKVDEYRIFGVLKESSLISPSRATFGGFAKLETPMNYERDFTFLIKDFFRIQKDIENLTIYFPPSELYSNVVSYQNLKKYLNQKIISVDTNQHIHLKENYLEFFSKGNRKKIQQFINKGGKVTKVGINEAKKVHDILKINRAARGVELSMNIELLEKKIQLLPARYELFLASIGDLNIAAAVVVNVDLEHRYVLFWGDLPDYRATSPVASIADYLIKDSLKKNFKILDLGISSVQGILDEGLFRFKKNLGAVHTAKFKVLYKK